MILLRSFATLDPRQSRLLPFTSWKSRSAYQFFLVVSSLCRTCVVRLNVAIFAIRSSTKQQEIRPQKQIFLVKYLRFWLSLLFCASSAKCKYLLTSSDASVAEESFWFLFGLWWAGLIWLCEVHLWSEHLAVTAGPFCDSNKKILSWTPHPHWRSPKAIWAKYSAHIWQVGCMSQTPPLKVSKGYLGQIQCTHMAGWLDVPDPLPPLKVSPLPFQFGLMWKQETKGGGLRTAVASALLLVVKGTTHHVVRTHAHVYSRFSELCTTFPIPREFKTKDGCFNANALDAISWFWSVPCETLWVERSLGA